VILVVFALELASAVLPPVHDAFVSFPTTIVVLVAGTIGVRRLRFSGAHADGPAGEARAVRSRCR
jgi:hypothetical protein